MTPAEKYVTAAYIVILVVVVAYVLIIALKLQRLDREAEDAVSGSHSAHSPGSGPERRSNRGETHHLDEHSTLLEVGDGAVPHL